MVSRASETNPQPSSPCLHACGFRDGCCKNCFRTAEEVNGWRTFGPKEKARVLELAAQRRLAAGK